MQHAVVASFVGTVIRPQASKEVGGGSSSCGKTTPAARALARAPTKQGVIMTRPLHEIDYARSNGGRVLTKTRARHSGAGILRRRMLWNALCWRSGTERSSVGTMLTPRTRHRGTGAWSHQQSCIGVLQLGA